MKIAIVLNTYNFFDWTKESLRTLEKYTDKKWYDLYVIACGCTDGTNDFLLKKGYKVKILQDRIGCGAGFMQGVKFARENGTYSYICPTHNDILYTEGWLEALIVEIEHYPSCAQMGIAQVINKEALSYSDEMRNNIAKQLRENKTGFANLQPCLMKDFLFDETGYYDPNFVENECDDADYNKRICDAGYDILSTQKGVLWHGLSIVRNTLPGIEAIKKRNQEYFKKKHNVTDFEKWNHIKVESKFIDGLPLLFYTV